MFTFKLYNILAIHMQFIFLDFLTFVAYVFAVNINIKINISDCELGQRSIFYLFTPIPPPISFFSSSLFTVYRINRN